MKKPVLYIALLASLLASTPAHASDDSLWSTAIGAALGGYVGSTIGKGDGNLAATAAGTLIGAHIGHSFGRSSYKHTYYRNIQPVRYAPAFRPYHPNYVAPVTSYHNDYRNRHAPQKHAYNPPHTVRVEKGYMGQYPHNQRRKGRHCREFTQTIKIDGQIHESYGIACLRPDGSWQVQK